MGTEREEFGLKLFKQAFDSAPIGIAIVGRDSEWQYVNEELCSILGLAPLEFKNRTWRDFTVNEDIDADQAQVNECLKRNGSNGYCMEKRYHRKAPGEWLWASLVVSVVRDSDGNFERFISYIVPCSRPGVAVISLAWAVKNWKAIGSALSASILFIGWAFGWISSEKITAIKTLFLQ